MSRFIFSENSKKKKKKKCLSHGAEGLEKWEMSNLISVNEFYFEMQNLEISSLEKQVVKQNELEHRYHINPKYSETITPHHTWWNKFDQFYHLLICLKPARCVPNSEDLDQTLLYPRGSQFFPYKVELFSEGDKNNFTKVTSPENIKLQRSLPVLYVYINWCLHSLWPT